MDREMNCALLYLWVFSIEAYLDAYVMTTARAAQNSSVKMDLQGD